MEFNTTPEIKELHWVPSEAVWYRAEERRKQAFDLLYGPVLQAVKAAWQAELPARAWPQAERCVARGLRSGLELLTMTTKHKLFRVAWSPIGVSALPAYWEPPRAEREPELPKHQLQAYRWTAAVAALEVRNSLEDLHSAYTRDAGMVALNRGIRDTIYQVLLSDPGLIWDLSSMPRLVLLAAHNDLPGATIPKVAG